MKYIYLILLMSGYQLMQSQDYFSDIISTTDNPLVKVLKKVDGMYLIPCDFFSSEGVKGGLIIVNKIGEIERNKFENVDLAGDPLVVVDNEYFLLGENPFREGDSTFFITKLDDPLGDQIWYKELNIENPKLNPRTILSVDNFLFVVNLELESPTNYPQEISLFKFNLKGDFLDVKKYNTNKWASGAWQSIITADSSILISCIINEVNNGPNGPYSQLLKLNIDGDIIWNYEGEEDLDNGAVPIWVAELSDTKILQTYYVDRRNDVDFIVNNWFPEPNKFIWLSNDGGLMQEKYIVTDKEDFLYYDGVKTGNGDYFFAFGYHEDRRPVIYDQFYAHLTKFSNAGDTIWSRNYQHPNYPQGNVIHTIKDIVEEINGDITILTDIASPGQKSEIWLFKVNSEGCFVNEKCEDMSVITSIEDQNYSNQTIYPNPSNGRFEIYGKHNDVHLFDVYGNEITFVASFNGGSTLVEVPNFSNGLYYFTSSSDGLRIKKKIILINK